MSDELRAKFEKMRSAVEKADSAFQSIHDFMAANPTMEQWTLQETRAALIVAFTALATLFEFKTSVFHRLFPDVLRTLADATEKETQKKLKQYRHEIASVAAAARLTKDKDGKQAAKAEAHVRWNAWQRGEVIYKSGAAFARSIVQQLNIDSPKTVERWMKKWADEAKANRD